MELKNPFGLRDNQIILIEDLSENENGLRCNCVCPACGEPFEARMGSVRRHHFAHSGEGCDFVNAYLAGLYMLLAEYLTSGNPLHLPPLIAKFDLSAYSYITEENANEHIILQSFSISPEREIRVYEASNITFDKAEIIKTTNGRSCAIIAEKANRKLAIKVLPPSTVCKDGDVSRYKDYPTVEIDFTYDDDMIYKSKKEDFFAYIQSNPNIVRWIYNPKIKEAFPAIFSRSKKYYDVAQERKRKQEEERRRIEEERQRLAEAERARRIEIQKAQALEAEKRRLEADKRKNEAEKHEVKAASERQAQKSDTAEIKPRPHSNDKQRDLLIGYNEVKDLFTQQESQIRDSFGTRWIKCEVCGKIAPSSDFSFYGGYNRINLGTCADCTRNKRQ